MTQLYHCDKLEWLKNFVETPKQIEAINAEIGSYKDSSVVADALNNLAKELHSLEDCKCFAVALEDIAKSEFIKNKLYNPAGIWLFTQLIEVALDDPENRIEILKSHIVLDQDSINPPAERRAQYRKLHHDHILTNLYNFVAQTPIENWEKVIVVEAAMYGGKTTTGLEIFYLLNEDKRNILVPIILLSWGRIPFT